MPFLNLPRLRRGHGKWVYGHQGSVLMLTEQAHALGPEGSSSEPASLFTSSVPCAELVNQFVPWLPNL